MNSIELTVNLNDNKPKLPPESNFYYVDQGNYQTFQLKDEPLTIYSDSATSCIIVVVVAQKGEENTATIAHLDSPECIKKFFKIIEDRNADNYQIAAQGANPADNDTSKKNAAQLKDSIEALGSKVTKTELSLLKGDPREHNRGHFGLIFDGNNEAVATNQPYRLELYQRDPLCGGQTVYSIIRRHEQPPVRIRDAGKPFTHPELVELASIALTYHKPKDNKNKKSDNSRTAFTNIVNLESEEILEIWSTTPKYEASWFSDQLKLGAAFAIAMAPVVSLSEKHLLKTYPQAFLNLRDAIKNSSKRDSV